MRSSAAFVIFKRNSCPSAARRWKFSSRSEDKRRATACSPKRSEQRRSATSMGVDDTGADTTSPETDVLMFVTYLSGGIYPGSSILDARQHAKHLEQQISAQQRGVAGHVVRRTDFDQVASNYLQPLAAPDYLQSLR